MDNMKKIILIILIAFIAMTAHAAGVYMPVQGGTGIGSATAGDVNKCLIVSNNAPFTYTLGTCGSSGGGSSGGTWSTTTSNVSGRLINYPNNNTDIVNIGSQSTTTGKFWFDPNISRSWLQYASTTGLTVTGASYIPKLSNLTGNGFVKTSGSDGTLSIDTNTYLTGITSGDVTTALGYTPLNQSLYYSTTTHTSITSLPNLSITKSQVSDFGTYLTTESDPLSLHLSDWYSTTTHKLLSSLPALSITKSQVSDFGTYQAPLISGTNIKTINGSSILGSGDLTVVGGSGLSSSTPWTPGSLVVAKDNASVTTIATSTIKTSQLTNDAGFLTSYTSPYEIATTSGIAIPQLAYFTNISGRTTLGGVATGTISNGTGISVTAGQSVIGSGLTITNTAPDQTVTLNNGTGISVTGTYPTFTITNTGSTFAFPWTVNTGYNSTSTTIGFLNGLFSTASSTFGSATYFPSLSQGFAYIGSAGKLNSVASSSINLSGFNNDLANLTATNASLTFSGNYNGSTARTVGLNVGNANSWTALQTFANSSTTLGSFSYASSTQYFGAGLTTCNSSNFLQWSGGSFGCGTPSGSGTVTSVVAGAGFQNQGLNITGSGTLVGAFATSATPVLGGLPYYTGVGDATTPAKLGSVATSSIAVGNGLSSSGTLGSQVGGTASTISINSTGLSTKALVTWNGTNLVATGTPQLTVGNILATTTTATSTFAGAIGVGTTSPVSKFVVAGAILGTENKPATSTSMTIDFSTYNQHVVQLGTSATTLTLTGLYAGQAVRIPVCNPGSTASTVTWATSPAGLLLWPGGTVPTQTTTANKCDIYTFTVTQATSTTGAVKVLGGYVQNF